MSSFHVLTDSNCHIPESLCNELDISVVPLPYAWEGKTYIDGESFAPREFYQKLRSSRELPTTSAPTPGTFIQTMEELLSDGKPVLGIFVGAEFSSTLSTAKLAARELEQDRIAIFDSRSNALGLGFQVLAAARLARAGGSLDEALKLLQEVSANSGVIFAVPALEHLRRGGRIGLARSLLGSALDIVPILEINAGPISPIDRVRTKKNALAILPDLVEARLKGERPFRIGLLHSDAESYAWQLRGVIESRFHPEEIIITELNPILAIHVGPDAFGLAYSQGA